MLEQQLLQELLVAEAVQALTARIVLTVLLVEQGLAALAGL
jgi:hypothetical protein